MRANGKRAPGGRVFPGTIAPTANRGQSPPGATNTVLNAWRLTGQDKNPVLTFILSGAPCRQKASNSCRTQEEQDEGPGADPTPGYTKRSFVPGTQNVRIHP